MIIVTLSQANVHVVLHETSLADTGSGMLRTMGVARIFQRGGSH